MPQAHHQVRVARFARHPQLELDRTGELDLLGRARQREAYAVRRIAPARVVLRVRGLNGRSEPEASIACVQEVRRPLRPRERPLLLVAPAVALPAEPYRELDRRLLLDAGVDVLEPAVE